MTCTCKIESRLGATDAGQTSSVVGISSPFRVASFLAAFALAGCVFDSNGAFSKSAARGDETTAKASAKLKSAAHVDMADESADNGDQGLDEWLSALVVPERLSTRAKETDKLKFMMELRGLLVEGFKDKGDSAEAARKHFESAHRLPIDDPRAAYAYGVVLLEQKKTVAALEQFRAAAKQKKAPFLPALQGVAWTSLSRGEHLQALPALLDLAYRLEESQETWPAPEDKEHSAEWLGRMVGFLAGPGKTEEQVAHVEKLAVDVANLLTGERKQAYERGRQAVVARYDELKAYAARPAEELVAEASQKRDEIVAAAVAAERDVKKIEDELRALKKPHDKQLADLSRKIHDNAMKVKTMASRQTAAEAEVDEFSEPKMHASVRSQGNSRRPTLKVIRNENAGEKKIRESQLSSAQKKLDNLKSSIEDARKTIADAKRQRDEGQVEYRKATAGHRQALQEAQHKAAEISARARDAEHGPLTLEKLKARVTSLEAYVPLYPELEKDRLLATLKPAS